MKLRARGMAAAVLAVGPVLIASTVLAGSLDLGYKNTGISFGNSKNFNGLRLNLVDQGVERVNGVNVTLWKPGKNPSATVNGLSLALIGTDVAEFNGVSLALIGSQIERTRGISLSLIGLSVREEFAGIAVGGIGVGGGTLKGIALGGIGVGADDIRGAALGLVGVGSDNIDGVALGLIGVGSDDIDGVAAGLIGLGGKQLRGFGVGGLGVGGEDLTGVFIGGLGAGAERFKGVGIGGLGVGAEKLTGFFAGGVGCGAQHFKGVGIAGLGVGAEDFRGVALAVGATACDDARWFTMAAYNRAKYDMVGLQIGLVNMAGRLHGVQLGALNYVGNNPVWARVLPLINLRL